MQGSPALYGRGERKKVNQLSPVERAAEIHFL